MTLTQFGEIGTVALFRELAGWSAAASDWLKALNTVSAVFLLAGSRVWHLVDASAN